jgi:serine/threonine protein kinase
VTDDVDTVGTPSRRATTGDTTGVIGRVLAERYRVLELVGRGGMGVVYRARDLAIGADVALKLIAPRLADHPALLEALRGEVRLARRVTHPNVCRIHDLEQSDGLTFVTMEHVDGESLDVKIARDGPVSEATACAILRDVGAGLAAAHAAGIVHRDLKPANVLLAATGRAVIADFGVAIEADEPDAGIAGTRGFMAPEQASGGPVDARVDVHALGVLAYRLVTAVDAARAPTVTGARADHLPAVSEAELAGLPAGLRAFVARCVAVDPADRPDIPAALAFRRGGRAGAGSRSPPPRSGWSRWSRRPGWCGWRAIARRRRRPAR